LCVLSLEVRRKREEPALSRAGSLRRLIYEKKPRAIASVRPSGEREKGGKGATSDATEKLILGKKLKKL